MSVPRILLLSGYAPGNRGIGELLLRDFCGHYPQDAQCCFCIRPARTSSPDFEWLPVEYAGRPIEGGIGRAGSALECRTAPFVQWWLRRSVLPRIAQRAVEFGGRHRVDMVWAFLDSPSLVALSAPVARQLGARLILTVMDPPDYWAREATGSAWVWRMVMSEFTSAMKMADGCAVASEIASDEYNRKYSTRCVLWRKAISESLWRKSPGVRKPTDDFIIAYAGGGIYAKREFQALLDALDLMGWRVGGRAVRLRLLLSAFSIDRRKPSQIEFLGYRREDEALSLLAEADVAYLPYWFDSFFSVSVRYCFPSKLPSYLAAGLPVFYHGPRDSSVTRFFDRYRVGICCHDSHPNAVAKALESFASDTGVRRIAFEEGRRALCEQFDMPVFLQRTAELLNVPPELVGLP